MAPFCRIRKNIHGGKIAYNFQKKISAVVKIAHESRRQQDQRRKYSGDKDNDSSPFNIARVEHSHS